MYATESSAAARGEEGGAAAARRYTATARLLHWLTVALIFLIMVPLGLWLSYASPKDEAFKLTLYNIHESTGVTIWLLTLFRLFWRAGHPPPPLPADLPGALKLAAHLNHAGLYALLLTMPIIGFLATNAFGFPLTWYGLIGPIPSPVGKDVPLAEVLKLVHRYMAWTLVALLAAHVPAALWHHFIRRDDTLRRML